MTDERRIVFTCLCFATALALAASPAFAQEPSEECFPSCRSGYLCHEGACISRCNPPCADDEKCTPEGECVAEEPVAPPPQPVPPLAVSREPETRAEPAPPVVSPALEPQPVPIVTMTPVVEPSPKESGVALGLTLGAATCASGGDYGCKTADGDAGIYASLRGGYMFLPWLVADLEVSLVPLFISGEDGAEMILTTGLGARFYPLGHRGRVDPVLGLHVGYSMQYSKGDGAVIDYTVSNGVYLGYGVGVDFNFAPAFSLGLMLDIIEPFWIEACSRYPAVEYDATTMTGGTAETTKCNDSSAENNQLFFGAGVSGSFFL